MPLFRYGKPFKWFAWHPVWVEGRGWRWLRVVWRARCFPDMREANPFWVQFHPADWQERAQ